MGKLVSLKLPPGAVRGGTEYESEGRWRDVNWVRWDDTGLRPVGGFSPVAENYTSLNVTPNDPVRDGYAQTGASSAFFALLYGTKSELKAFRRSNTGMTTSATTADVTPSGLATPNADIGESWSFGGWGDYILSCLRADGRIWETFSGSAPTTAVTNAPIDNLAVYVTPEFFVFALGAGGNVKKVEWSDRGDRTVWTPAPTNQAGGFELDTQGSIVFAKEVRGVTVVVTTKDVWRARYVGYPDVYVFEKIGNASCVAPSGVVLDDVLYWATDKNIYATDGSSVTKVPCSVGDYVFNELMRGIRTQSYKIRGWANRRYGEVWWHFPTNEPANVDNEPALYVAFNPQTGAWHYGKSGITCVVPDADVSNIPEGSKNVAFLGTGSSLYYDNPVSANTWEYVTDPGFDNPAAWVTEGDWSVSGSSATGTTGQIYQELPMVRGIPYIVEATTTMTSTGIDGPRLKLNGSTVTTLGAIGGTFQYRLQAQSYSDNVEPFIGRLSIESSAGGFDGVVDSVSVRPMFAMCVDSDNPTVADNGASFYVGHIEAPYAETGPVKLGDGDVRLHATRLIPDERNAGDTRVTFKTKEYPAGSETTHGPYKTTAPTSVRFSGRQVKMRVEAAGEDTVAWRTGVHRLEVAPGGSR